MSSSRINRFLRPADDPVENECLLCPVILVGAEPGRPYRYPHEVDGRDAEIASGLSDLAAHGDAAKLLKSIVVKH